MDWILEAELAARADHTLIARLMCEGKLGYESDYGCWHIGTSQDCFKTTLDAYGVPRITPELRQAIKEAGL